MKFKTEFRVLKLKDIVPPPYNPREGIVKGSDEYEALRPRLALLPAPTFAVYAAALDTVTAQFAALTQMPGFSRDAVPAQLAAAMGQAGESELSGLSAEAELQVGLEYQALGISDAVQMNYLMQTGGRMLGLTQ